MPARPTTDSRSGGGASDGDDLAEVRRLLTEARQLLDERRQAQREGDDAAPAGAPRHDDG